MALHIVHYPVPPIGPAPVAQPVADFPAPLVTSHDPIPGKAPAVVSKLIRLAEARNWKVELTYSEGYEPHATYGTPSAKPKAKWALRMARGERRAVAVRTDSAWTSLWTWSPDQFFQPAQGLHEFERAISRD